MKHLWVFFYKFTLWSLVLTCGWWVLTKALEIMNNYPNNFSFWGALLIIFAIDFIVLSAFWIIWGKSIMALSGKVKELFKRETENS